MSRDTRYLVLAWPRNASAPPTRIALCTQLLVVCEVAMADPLSDPTFLFSPSQLSSLTSVEPGTPPLRPQRDMLTRRRIQCYVAPPRLPSSIKELYQRLPEYLGGDPEFVRDDLDAVVGEYPLDSHGKPSHYFVRFKDGLARRVSPLIIFFFQIEPSLDFFAYISCSLQ